MISDPKYKILPSFFIDLLTVSIYMLTYTTIMTLFKPKPAPASDLASEDTYLTPTHIVSKPTTSFSSLVLCVRKHFNSLIVVNITNTAVIVLSN